MEYSKRKGLLKTLILSIVIENKMIHGYGIYKAISDSSIKYFPSIGTIYRLLGELYKEGLIDKIEVSGNKKKVYYTPTNKGLEEFINITTCFLNKTVRGLSVITPVLKRLYEENRGFNLFNIESKIEELYSISKEFLESIRKPREIQMPKTSLKIDRDEDSTEKRSVRYRV
ncbi:MAG: PadR family transcriptional regulator [Desulfurococcaceae archaeon]